MTREEAINLIASEDPIGGAEAVLLAAGCTNIVFAGRTKMGNGFSLTNKTDRFVRGMVRKALKQDIDDQDANARARRDEESAREDQWFEQRNVPR